MDLKQLELDMLEQIYNIILTIPDTVVFSIPSIKSPLILSQLKRMRQKIKNKMKIGNTRLINECYSIPPNSNNYRFETHKNKSKISIVNGFDEITNSHVYRSENQTSKSTNYGSNSFDNSELNKTCNQNNIYNESNSITNKWISSDFQSNNILPTRLTTNHSDIYTRERLNVNELECIVNDSHFDSFSVSDLKIHNGSENYNHNLSMSTHLEKQKIPYENNSKEGNKHIILSNSTKFN